MSAATANKSVKIISKTGKSVEKSSNKCEQTLSNGSVDVLLHKWFQKQTRFRF